MAKFETVKAGDRLWDVRRSKGPGSHRHRWDTWPVDIISIDYEAGTAVVVWNVMNPKQTYTRRSVEKLRRSRPKSE